MAHSAKLYLEDDVIQVQEFHWGIMQPTDGQSRPQSGITAGKISLVLDKLHHPVLDAWMADERKLLSGTLLADSPDGMGSARSLRFVDALCVSQGLSFSASGGGHFAGTMSLQLTARELHVDGSLLIDNQWPGLG